MSTWTTRRARPSIRWAGRGLVGRFRRPDCDWAAWDFLRCWIYVETSRNALPLEPIGLGLHTPDRANAYNRTLGELRKDQWIEIRLPISQIARAQDVRQIQFHVAESNYKHGDRVDFYLNDLALVRYAEPTLFNLTAENSVLFSDAAHLPVRFELLGVKPSSQAHVICELRRDGRVVASASVELSRGLQRVVLDLTDRKLSPGTYEVTRPSTIGCRTRTHPFASLSRLGSKS